MIKINSKTKVILKNLKAEISYYKIKNSYNFWKTCIKIDKNYSIMGKHIGATCYQKQRIEILFKNETKKA